MYIGAEPNIGNYSMLDAITTSATATYNLLKGGASYTPENPLGVICSLNGVIQKAGSSFNIVNNTIVFSQALTSNDSIDFILVMGERIDLNVPADASVNNAKTNFVSTSSNAGLSIKGDGTTDGTLQLNCSQNSHGIKLKSPPHSASASYTLTFPNDDGDADQFLQTNGSGVMTWADAGGGITEADMWRTTTDTSGASGTFSSNWERVDTYSFSHLGTGMSQSSGIFTFPSTGFYRISFQSNFTGTSIQYAGIMLMLTTNNSSYNQHVKQYTSLGNSSYETSVSLEGIVDITNVSTHKVRFDQQQSASGGVWAGGSSNRTSATFIKLADT